MAASTSPAFQLHPMPRRPAAAVVEQLGSIPTPNLSDSLGKLSPGAGALKPLHRKGRLAGPAFTVRVPPGDNLLVYHAIAQAQAGDVLVVDAGGLLEQATIGEIMSTWAASRGLAGMVIYGAVRDIDVIAASDFPVYACGVTPRGPYRDGPGQLNVSISLGGMVVSPGDLIVGDANGIVAVPYEQLEHAARTAAEIQQREESLVTQILAGAYDASWIEPALRERGFAV